MEYAGYIDGAFVKGAGDTLSVEDPSYGKEFASFPGLSVSQIKQAIDSSRRAYDDGRWSGLSAQDRAVILRKFAKALASRADRIAAIEVQEAGCPKSSAVMHAQVATPIKQTNEVIDLFLTLPEFEDNKIPMRERLNPQGGLVQSMSRYAPVGVVAGIAAYNFPFYTAMWKVLPSLIAGNTCILRPSPLTPLSAMIFAEAAQEAELPAGVLNVVLESGLEGSQLMTTDLAVDMVAFTGSSHVGTLIMQQAAPTMKRLQLELGGKSASIYLPDSVEKSAMAAAIVCMSHAGQGCALGTRVFVPEDRKAEAIERMIEPVKRFKIGPADDAETQMGPVINAAQRARCERYVGLAVEAGARVAFGGKRPGHLDKGYFFEPTILDVPDNSNPAAQDEIFGPVVSVIGYRDLDHVIQMANDSRFGLSGYVQGADRQAALKVALGVRSGTVHVNGGLMSAFVSSGGQRMSGVARERGVEGLRIYQQMSVLNLGS